MRSAIYQVTGTRRRLDPRELRTSIINLMSHHDTSPAQQPNPYVSLAAVNLSYPRRLFASSNYWRFRRRVTQIFY